MIGKAYTSVFKYYDAGNRRMSFKRRPVLVVGKADDSDYVILPISRVTNRNNLDAHYDVAIDSTSTPLMNLSQRSYIRTHKQSVVHVGELVREMVNFKEEYSDIYLEVINKMKEFQEELYSNALR